MINFSKLNWKLMEILSNCHSNCPVSSHHSASGNKILRCRDMPQLAPQQFPAPIAGDCHFTTKVVASFRIFTSSGQRPSILLGFINSGQRIHFCPVASNFFSFAICVLRFKVHSTASSKRGYLDAPARSLQLKRGLNNKQLCQNCQNCQTTKAKKSNSEILPQTGNLIMGFIRQNAAAGLKTVRNSPESFYNPS